MRCGRARFWSVIVYYVLSLLEDADVHRWYREVEVNSGADVIAD